MKYIILLLQVVLLATACNPSKRAAKQKAELDKLCSICVEEFVKNNPCPQLPVIDLDSLCTAIGYSDNDFYVMEEASDTAKNPEGKKTGSSCNHKPPKPERILVPGPPDERRIRMLSDSLASVRLQLAFCTGKVSIAEPILLPCGKWKWNNWSWLFTGLLLLHVLVIVWLIKRKGR